MGINNTKRAPQFEVPLLDFALFSRRGIEQRSGSYCLNIARPSELNRNTPARTAVSFANSSSIPFFFPNIDSPAPVIAPDNPALLPD
jgi:hypothetical protein